MQFNKKKKNYPLKTLLDQSPSSAPEGTLSFTGPPAQGIVSICTTIILYLFLHKCVQVTLGLKFSQDRRTLLNSTV